MSRDRNRGGGYNTDEATIGETLGRAAGNAGLGVKIAGVMIILLILAFFYVHTFGYAFHQVSAEEVAVRFLEGKIVDVVGPGLYTDLRPFASITDIKVEGLQFYAYDKEVITKDLQRLGVVVSGTVHRPGLTKSAAIIENWQNYKTFYLNDATLVAQEKKDEKGNIIQKHGLMVDLGQQAMKVCVGDRPFDEAVVGTARDVLRQCIDVELDKLASSYGLEARNVIVPDVIILPEVQDKLDEITQARLATDLAKQNESRLVAEANRNLAEQQGQIRVEQGKVQEKNKQDKLTADLERQALEVKAKVIEAQKANDLLGAQKDLEIAKSRRAAAAEQALADLANQAALAAMYQGNPEYVRLLIAQAVAGAYKSTDKVILPAGVDPVILLGGAGTPLVNVPPK